MASIILPPGSAPANPSEGELYYDNTAKQVKFRDNAGFKGLGTADLQGEPHIITKKLFPAYLGKLLDDTTSHSGDYGTEQADGRMYYYTDIAGSKPIHDPRIGAHFGSQRHTARSLQLLEQETATHGKDVFTVDGREWFRAVQSTAGNSWYVTYDSNGNFIATNSDSTGGFLEITGFFNDINFISTTAADIGTDVDILVNGTSSVTDLSVGESTVTSPLLSRYVSGGSLINGGSTVSASLGSTPKINTLKFLIGSTGQQTRFHGIELITQDTTSSSTKVQIQVPAQDVVSYGRKFSVSATAQHYDPFNGFTSGASVSSYVDTATSLGLSKWLHSSTYYRPYNGMRVVKWIDENGAIKTSVTCMPPNAKSIADSSALTNATAKANASVANDTFYPTFEAHTTSVNEDNLHEVAKTFHVREFGNGSANGGTGATWADASMLNDTDTIAYCMDDGLTSFAGDTVKAVNTGMTPPNSGTPTWYTTFIGTGIAIYSKDYGDLTHNIAQNLPYGSHILKGIRDVPNTDAKASYTLDGILFDDVTGDTYGTVTEIHIYQPKKPPIPDSACVLADYMVFADFKPQTTAGTQLISKGVRRQNISRDVFFDETDGDSFTFSANGTFPEGFVIHLSGNADSDTSMKMRIPSFGTNYVHRGYQHDTRSKLFIGDTDNDSNATKDNTATYGSYAHLTSDLTLGVYNFGSNSVSGQNGNMSSFDIVTPIHTSHHYQTFETPFLHELIGGDRSMEQTNLICSSDGKSWDEVTRDTSYIGVDGFLVRGQQDTNGTSQTHIFTQYRGVTYNTEQYNKNFAIAYDRMICLKDGLYEISYAAIDNYTLEASIKVNGAYTIRGHHAAISWTNNYISIALNLKRGDYIQIYGNHSEHQNFSKFECIRVK